MRKTIKRLLLILFAVSGAAMLAFDAQAQISMPEREHAQTIVWVVEALTFVTTFGIVLLVWKISRRDSKTKNRNRINIKSEEP